MTSKLSPLSPAQLESIGRVFASFDIDPTKPDFSGLSPSMVREMFTEMARYIAPEQWDELIDGDPRFVGLFKPVQTN